MAADDPGHESTLAATVASVSEAERAPGSGVIATGMKIDRFVIEERLGAGAMGVVYAARDPQLDRRIALKLIRASTRHAGLAARLVREAQALARVAHPNVVVVHEVGDHDGQVFVAMELITGETLRSWFATPRTRDEILKMMIQAGRGLAAAHAAELVHRDFKPDNVLIGEDGRPRVTDFGLARVQGDSILPLDEVDTTGSPIGSPIEAQLTQTGAMVGTPVYSSPEQLAGERVGEAADQFSFCVTTWEALYGARPFPATNIADLIDDVTAGRVVEPPPGKRAPARIHRALVRGLAPKAEDRHPSMDELLRELELSRGGAAAAWLVGGFAAVAIVAGIGIGLGAGGGADTTCVDDAKLIATVWNPTRAAAIEKKIAAAKMRDGDRLYAEVAAILDRYALAWKTERQAACEGGEAGKARIGCLDIRLVELDKTLGSLAADLIQSPRIVRAVLEPPSLCGTSAGEGKPVLALWQGINEARRAWMVGDRKQATRKFGELADQARSLNYSPARAQVLIAHASLIDLDADNAGAMAMLREAIVEAETSGDDQTKLEAQASLTHVLIDRGELDEAGNMLQLAEATLSRFGIDLDAEGELALARARVAQGRGEWAVSIPLLERAIELFAQTAHRDMNAPAALLVAYQKLGRAEDAERMLKQIAKDVEQPLDGYAKGKAALDAVTECKNAEQSGDLDRMLEACARTVERLGAGNDAFAVYALLVLATARELREERSEAREYFQRMAAIYEGTDQRLDLAEALENAARQSLELGEVDKAIDGYRRSAEIATALGKRGEAQLVFARSGLGRSFAAAKQPAAGVVELEWALPRLEALAPPRRASLAGTRLALAQALWDRNGESDRVRAKGLAAIAKADAAGNRQNIAPGSFAPHLTKHADKLIKRVDNWIATHR